MKGSEISVISPACVSYKFSERQRKMQALVNTIMNQNEGNEKIFAS